MKPPLSFSENTSFYRYINLINGSFREKGGILAS